MRAALALFALGTALLLLLAPGEGRRKSRVVPEQRAEAPAPPPAGEEAAGSLPGPAEPAAPGPVADAVVSGTVVSGGRPVAGAVVWFNDGTTVVTDADGRWTAAACEGAAGAWHPDLGYSNRSSPDFPATLELAPGVDHEVLAVDAVSGDPVALADVRVPGLGFAGTRAEWNVAWERAVGRNAPGQLFLRDPAFALAEPDWSPHSLEMRTGYQPGAVTDAQGRATLRQLPPGRVRLLVRRTGYAPAILDVDPGGLSRSTTVRLTPAGAIDVIAPAAGEPLCCTLDSWGVEERFLAARLFDSAGRASFEGLPAGEFRVRCVARARLEGRPGAEAIGGAPGEAAGLRATVRMGERTVLDFSGESRACIEGRIAGGSFRPSGGAVFLLGGRDCRDQMASAGYDAEGRFRFEDVGPGSYRLLLSPRWDAPVTAEVEVRPGERAVTVEMTPGSAALEGSAPGAGGILVVDPAVPRRPPVSNMSDFAEGFVGSIELRPDGGFRMRGLRPGRYRAWCLWDAALARRDFELAEGETKRLDFTPEGGVPLRLLVRGPKSPELLVAPAGEGFASLTIQGVEATLLLPAGEYLVSAAAEGFAPVRERPVRLSGPLEVAIGMEPALEATLRLRRGGLPAQGVAVELRDRAGAPPGAGGSRPLVADADGVARFAPLAPGRYAALVGGREIGSFDLVDRPLDISFEVP